MKKVNRVSTRLHNYVTKANKNAKIIELNLTDLNITTQVDESKDEGKDYSQDVLVALNAHFY